MILRFPSDIAVLLIHPCIEYYSIYCAALALILLILVECLGFNFHFWQAQRQVTGTKIKSISGIKGWCFCNIFFVNYMWAWELWNYGLKLKKIISKCGQGLRNVDCHGKYDYSITVQLLALYCIQWTQSTFYSDYKTFSLVIILIEFVGQLPERTDNQIITHSWSPWFTWV